MSRSLRPLHRRLLAAAGAVVVVLLSCVAARADTTLNQGQISTTIFRKLRSAQNQIRGGQYNDAQTQLAYLQGVATDAYEAAVVRELASDLAIARGDYAGALANLQPVYQQNILPPNEQREVQATLAKLYVSTGQFQSAADMLRAILATTDNPPVDVLVTAAQAYAGLNQCRESAGYAKRAIDAVTEPPPDWYQLWIACLYQVRDYAAAADGLQTLLTRYPDQLGYWQQLGEAYAHAGDTSRAVAVYTLMYRQGLLRQSQDFLNLASLYMQNGEPFQAGQVLQDSLQSGALPATEANYGLLATAWRQAHETERAVAALGEVAKLAQSGDAYFEQAQLYALRHDWVAVIDTSKKALSKGQLKRPGRAWLLQGVALTESRQYDEAANALREAAKYDDSRPQAEAWLKYLSARGAAS